MQAHSLDAVVIGQQYSHRVVCRLRLIARQEGILVSHTISGARLMNSKSTKRNQTDTKPLNQWLRISLWVIFGGGILLSITYLTVYSERPFHMIDSELRVFYGDYEAVESTGVDYIPKKAGSTYEARVRVEWIDHNGQPDQSEFRVAGRRTYQSARFANRMSRSRYPRGQPTWVYVSRSGGESFLREEIHRSGVYLAMALMPLSIRAIPVAMGSMFGMLFVSEWLVKRLGRPATDEELKAYSVSTGWLPPPGLRMIEPLHKPVFWLLGIATWFSSINLIALSYWWFVHLCVTMVFVLCTIPFEEHIPSHWTQRPDTHIGLIALTYLGTCLFAFYLSYAKPRPAQ